MATGQGQIVIECLDNRFSTTRQVTRVPPKHTERNVAGDLQPHQARQGEGGLRTRGYFKLPRSDAPLITVITVVFNARDALEQTILSVLSQSYSNIEYIIVDGGSSDGTLDIIKQYEIAIDYWVSQPDRGIYDAMNKGIKLAHGDWLNFLNAKDAFADANTLHLLADKYLQSGKRFLYSDVLLVKQGLKKPYLYKCDHQRLILNHQASIYSAQLHDQYGPYLVAKGVTISDYLFFSLLDKGEYYKVNEPIARYDVTGTSQSKKSVRQKFIVDYLLNGMPKYKFLLYFLLYFYFRKFREVVFHR